MTVYPSPVARPVSAGTPQHAIAITHQAYVNIYDGPGTQYRDIGDLRNFTLVYHYPATRTGDGWMWIEQVGVSGWVMTSGVTFEEVYDEQSYTPQHATPYDGKVAVWHWRGDAIPENSIDELARSLKSRAPHVTQVFVKTSDYTPSTGAQWQGYWDTERGLAIDSPASIDRWVNGLKAHGLEFHAWCVPRGADIEAEANLIIQACNRPGVKSMILDVEPYAGFWMGGREAVRPLMTRIRRSIPANFHIGLCVDPRRRHFETIFPREWASFINSIHPMVYWVTMRREPDSILDETYAVWGEMGKPIIPILQGDADAISMEAALTLATKRHGAPGVSWWRLGVIGPVEWAAINKPLEVGAGAPEDSVVRYIDERIVKPGDPGFARFSHTGREELTAFEGAWGWQAYYKKTEAQTSKVAVRWSTSITVAGSYELAVFVPARHSSTRNARYKIHGVSGSNNEVLVTVDQSQRRNQWVTLGVFSFDPAQPNAGTVFLNDLTGESANEIAFDALRWRRVAAVEPPRAGETIPEGFADGYDAPIGSVVERRSPKVWPGQWIDASPFGRLYFVGSPSEAYHTGADLNLPANADAHTPVSACASGVVTFANRLPVWGNVIIIRHDPLVGSGKVMYSRYGHVEEMVVRVGERVARGQQIAKVGNAFGRWAYHLHFDLSPTDIFETKPDHWPKKDRVALLRHYVDPREFIEANRPRRS